MDQTSSRRAQQQHDEQLQQEMEKRLNEHIQEYPVRLAFPAEVVSSSNNKTRTDHNLVQHRLLEAGVLLDDVQKLGQATEAIAAFIRNLEETGCYNSVQVQIGNDDEEESNDSSTRSEEENAQKLQVILNEKRWYSLYVGGGVKQDSLYRGDTQQSLLPRLQFETRAKLLNLGGELDTTTLNYAIDQRSTTTLSLEHERPLFTVNAKYSPAYNNILSLPKGSQMAFSCRAMSDTVDHEWTRSYKEYQRLLAVKIANMGHTSMPEMIQGSSYSGLEWSLLFRDIMPRRHPSLPYGLDASPEILAQAGPSVKHSVSYEIRSNNDFVDSKVNPTSGLFYFSKAEVAGPPGDVGFWKYHGGLSYHWGFPSLCLHSAVQLGVLKPLSFGGLCSSKSSIADRFFLGGPMDLRGFVPAGIGPRAPTGGASTPGGDSLGGDFFYTATLAASMPFPAIPFLRDSGVRLFGFANVGTLVGSLDNTPLSAILKSTRASAGGGVSVGTKFGRLEAYYAVPLRHSRRDAKKSVQIGLGFHFS